jgi:antitoxin component YwqK of YwqJK toxin-antitoxin module
LPIFKDGIWEYGVIGESEKTISIEYSAKLAIDQCKNKNGENEIKNGIYLKKEKNGQVIVSGQYDNNNMDGVWKYYYKNGTLRCSVNYKKGLLSGKFSYYDNTGRVLIEGQYNDSKVNNNGWQRSLNYELDRIVFDENSVFNFPIEGLEGSYLYNFYGNGKSTKETYTYSNGQLLGPYEIYENGVLKEKGIKP